LEDAPLFNWKNMLKGLLIAAVVCGITYLLIVVIFPSWYGDARNFYWGNALVLLTFLAIVAAFFVDRGSTRRIQKETKDRYAKITWDHPKKIKYYDTTRVLYWTGIWGIILYMIFYALGLVNLDIDAISAIYALVQAIIVR
jgi:hypothetical protein